MSEAFLQGRVVMHCGDSRDVLGGLAAASIDSVVTDPPYALVSIAKRFGKPGAAPAKHGVDGAYARASAGFMGQSWDTGETAFAVAFWAEVLRVLKPGGWLVAFSGTRTYHRMAVAIEDAGFEIRGQIGWVYGSGFPKSHNVGKAIDRHLGAERGSGAAAEWNGWGTALKPAWEPIVLARKPLVGTVAENVIEHGTGGLNIDGCRVGKGEERASATGGMSRKASPVFGAFCGRDAVRTVTTDGRFPANIIHDGSDEVVASFPDAPGQMRSVGPEFAPKVGTAVYGDFGARRDMQPRGDIGSAARFFYQAKADAEDRLASKHPTVKPVDLMQYLVRLVTPPGGLVLDPFAGTGTTGEAAWREGCRAVLIEREPGYHDDIRRRLSTADAPLQRAAAVARVRGVAEPLPLFDGDRAP